MKVPNRKNNTFVRKLKDSTLLITTLKYIILTKEEMLKLKDN